MMPGKFDLKMYRGDSYTWEFKLWQDSNNTVPVSLTGATALAEIRDKPGGTKVCQLTCTIVQPNIIDMSMTPTNYATCPATGVWDLQITFSDGKVHTPIGGEVSVTPDVSDSL